MSKKMMLLVAGVLTAFAFASLAGTATAKETKLRCEGTGSCTFTATSGVTTFSTAGGETIKCETASGSGQVTNLDAERESTTGTIQVLYTGCKEQVTIFHFGCSNTATAGNITTNVMTVHSIALPGTTNGAGVLITGVNMTWTCAGGFAPIQMTGNEIGEAEEKCNTNTGAVHKLQFSTTSDGVQSLTSYTGATFRLEGKSNHASAEATYATAAKSGTGTTTWNQNVILTCA